MKVALKEALWVFFISRLAILILTYLGVSIMHEYSGSPVILNCFISSRQCLLAWMHWDVLSYISIAMNGYSDARATAFFPLWPLLLHCLGFLVGGSAVHYYLLGLVLANLLFYLALVLLYILSSELFDHKVAKTSLLYLAFAPYALFFFIGYTESLFVLLCLATFVFLQRGIKYGRGIHWLLAGLCGFLAALTRSQGFLLTLPYVIVFAERYILAGKLHMSGWREKILALAPIVLIPLGVASYMGYLWYTKGDPLLFSHVEASMWDRSLVPPWVGLYYALKALFVPGSLQALNVLNLASIIVSLFVLIIGWRRIPLYCSLFALVLIVFPLFYVEGTANALSALPRYMLIVFPVTMITASWKQPRIVTLCFALMLPLFTFNVLLFMLHYWVA